MKTIKGYKFIKEDMKSDSGDCLWELEKWKQHDGEIELCSAGFHACLTPLQSLNYILGGRWFMVEARGNIIHEAGRKFVASEMRLVQELPIKKILPPFALASASHVLHIFEKKFPEDRRVRTCLELTEIYLKNPTAENLEKLKAARAVRAAGDAAGDAAWAAAGAAAWAAAGAAAWAAAGAAEKKWQEKELMKIIKKVLR